MERIFPFSKTAGDIAGCLIFWLFYPRAVLHNLKQAGQGINIIVNRDILRAGFVLRVKPAGIHAGAARSLHVRGEGIADHQRAGLIKVRDARKDVVEKFLHRFLEARFLRDENIGQEGRKSACLNAAALGGTDSIYNDGLFRICLPGAVPVDYALSATFGYSSEGALPIVFKMGADIASVKYAIYQGKLADADIKTNVTAIAGNKEPKAKVVGETGVESVTLAKTDVYTLVAVGFDSKGEAQASVASSFNYVAKEDSEEYAVVVNAGLELTNRFEGAGATKVNSISFYVYGSKLTDVKMGLYDKATVDKYGMDAVYGDVLASASLKDEVLEKINNGGYSDVFTKLSPLTEYVLVVWATNGYQEKFVAKSLATEGLPFEKLGTATYNYSVVLPGESDKDLDFCVNPNYKNTYVVEDWCNGVDFTFTYDQTTGKVVVPLQSTALVNGGHEVQIIEAKNFYSPKYDKYDQLGDSKYDAATKTFTFFVAYVVVEPGLTGSYGFGEETLVLSKDVVLPATPGKAANFFSVQMPKSVKELSGQFTKSKSLSVPMCLAGFAVERESKSVEFSATPVAKSEVPAKSRQDAPVSVIR